MTSQCEPAEASEDPQVQQPSMYHTSAQSNTCDNNQYIQPDPTNVSGASGDCFAGLVRGPNNNNETFGSPGMMYRSYLPNAFAYVQSETYMNELMLDMQTLQRMQHFYPSLHLRRTHDATELLNRELTSVWQQQYPPMYQAMQRRDASRSVEDAALNSAIWTDHQNSQSQSSGRGTGNGTSETSSGQPPEMGQCITSERQDAGLYTVDLKLLIPEQPGVNFIGRIVGPRGITVKQMEQQYLCKILVRGRGSVKCEEREKKLLGRPGWEHLNENLHVLVSGSDRNQDMARSRVERAAKALSKLLTVEGDDNLKHVQLMELAIINGTYRPASQRWSAKDGDAQGDFPSGDQVSTPTPSPFTNEKSATGLLY